MEPLFVAAVVQHDIEASRHRHDQLLKFLVRMATAFGTSRNVVEIVNPLDLKRYVSAAFYEGKVAAWVGNLWQCHSVAVTKAHKSPKLGEEEPGRSLSPDDTRWVAYHRHACWDGFCNYRSSTYHRVPPDGDSREDYGGRSDRSALFDGCC